MSTAPARTSPFPHTITLQATPHPLTATDWVILPVAALIIGIFVLCALVGALFEAVSLLLIEVVLVIIVGCFFPFTGAWQNPPAHVNQDKKC